MGDIDSAGFREPGDAELLGVLLRTRCNGRDVPGLADRLLIRFGSLRQLLDADSAAILAEEGVGAARLAMIRAGHLFPSSRACISLRRGQYLRGYVYDFIGRVSPQWTRAAVDRELKVR